MLKYYALNDNGVIVGTTDIKFPQEGQETFDFPEDFDFMLQSNYRIINGELIEMSAAEIEEIAECEYWLNIPYDEAVNAEIRKRYTESQEFAILRQRDEKPLEYAEYFVYCEQCKEYVKQKKGM